MQVIQASSVKTEVITLRLLGTGKSQLKDSAVSATEPTILVCFPGVSYHEVVAVAQVAGSKPQPPFRSKKRVGKRELDRWADPSQLIATGTNYKLVTAFPETPVPFAQYLLRISFTFNSALFARRIP
jgi:hypothetical protein